MITNFRVFICDCDGIWQYADRAEPDNRRYFPDLERALTTLARLRRIGHVDDVLVCDFKEWAVMVDQRVVAHSKCADLAALAAMFEPEKT